MGRSMILLDCPICGKKDYPKSVYEHLRNLEKGRVTLCSRKCQATFMNLSPAKQAQTKAMLAARNADQYREKNPNWKGGISPPNKLKPLPPEKSGDPPS